LIVHPEIPLLFTFSVYLYLNHRFKLYFLLSYNCNSFKFLKQINWFTITNYVNRIIRRYFSGWQVDVCLGGKSRANERCVKYLFHAIMMTYSRRFRGWD